MSCNIPISLVELGKGSQKNITEKDIAGIIRFPDIMGNWPKPHRMRLFCVLSGLEIRNYQIIKFLYNNLLCGLVVLPPVPKETEVRDGREVQLQRHTVASFRLGHKFNSRRDP